MLENDDFVAQETSFLKKHNNIYISDDEVKILEKYDIEVDKYNNIGELLYDIEEILNESNGDYEDLEWVSLKLSEFNYYNNTNK